MNHNVAIQIGLASVVIGIALTVGLLITQNRQDWKFKLVSNGSTKAEQVKAFNQLQGRGSSCVNAEKHTTR